MKKAAKGQRIVSFRNRNLALTISMLLFFVGASAQTPIQYTPMTAAGYQFKYLKADSGINVPFRNLSLGRGTARPGDIVCNTVDSLLYYFNGIQFVLIGSGTGGTSGRDTVYVTDDLYVTLDSTGHQVIGHYHADGLVSGGIVTRAACLSLDETPATYYLNYKQYISAATTLTVPASDPSFPRTDEVIADTLGVVSLRTGTPSSTPLAAPINSSSEIVLATYTIAAGATCVGITTKVIYDEGVIPTNWDTTHAGTMTVRFRNTDNPHLGTHAVFVSSYVDQSSITFTDSGLDTVSNNEILKFFLYLNGRLYNRFQVQFFNGSTAVSNLVDITSYINVLDSNEYQNVSVPLNYFGWPGGQVFDRVIFKMAGTDNSGAKGYFLDDIELQKGVIGTQIDYSNKVDSVTIVSGSDYYWIKGVSHLIGVRSAGGGSGGNNIYNTDSTLSGNRLVTMANRTLDFRGSRVGFDSTTTGTDYTRIGVLLNENFSGGVLPAGWTKGSGLTVVYTGAKATITGASSLGAPTAGQPTTAYTSGLQYDTRRMPYEKVDFQMSVVPTTKSANALVGMGKGTLGLTVTSSEGIYWDLSNGTNSGRVALSYNAATPLLPTFVTNVDSTSKMNFSTGDSLVLYFKKNGTSVVAGIINKTTGQITVSYFNQLWNGSGGRWNLIFLNGTYVLTNVKVSVLDKKGGVWFLGDSQTGGYGSSQQSRRFSDLIFQGNYKYFGVLGLPSLAAKSFVSGGLVTEILNDVVPTKVVVAFGYNDETEGFTAAVTKADVDSIVYPLQRAGIHVGIMGIVPRPSSATDTWDSNLLTLATERGADAYDIRTLLKDATGKFNAAYNYDGVHINDSGAIVVKNVVIAKSGDSLLSEMAADTNYVARIYSLPSSRTETVVPLVGRNNDGTLVSVPNKFPTADAWIQNKYSSIAGGVSGTAQGNAAVYVSGPVKSDTSLQVKTVQGLRIGFNNGDATNTTGSNINITNAGAGGVGYPQAFDDITGNGNIKMIASSANKTKQSMTGIISGNNNSLFNSHLTSTLSGSDNIGIGAYNWAGTSGSNGIYLGASAGKGVTTGSANLHAIYVNTGASSFSAGLANSIILGEASTPEAFVAGDVSLNTGQFTNTNVWLGGRSGASTTTLNFNAPNGGTNTTAFDCAVRVSRGIGLSKAGSLLFQTWTPLGSGTTFQSTAITKIRMEYLGIGMGSTTVTTQAPDALLDLQSTTQAFLPPRVTTAQRDLIPTGLLTLAPNAPGSGYTNGNVALSFSGGGCTVQPAGYAVISGGAVQSTVMTARGYGCTSAPTATVTSGGGSGATFLITIGASTGSTIFCTDCVATDTSTGVMQTWNGTTWKNNW